MQKPNNEPLASNMNIGLNARIVAAIKHSTGTIKPVYGLLRKLKAFWMLIIAYIPIKAAGTTITNVSISMF